MIEIDICIISYAKTAQLKFTTESGIQSLIKSEKAGIKFNIFVVESNKEVNYDSFPNTKTIYTAEAFGYNKYLNIALREGKADYVLLANNDLLFTKNWALNIILEMNFDKELLSTCPFCPETNRITTPNVQPGYIVRQQVNGWAIFVKRKVFDIIGELPTDCTYWFSDNDYALTLQKHNIKHALIANSIVYHHSDNHGPTGNEILSADNSKLMRYTNGDYEIFKQKWGLDKSST